MPNFVDSLILNLSSDCPDDRQCACETIANLTEQFNSVENSQVKRAIHALKPLLNDSCLAVRLSAVGALRNLGVDLEDVALEMMAAEPELVMMLIDQLTMVHPIEDDSGVVPFNNSSIGLEATRLLNSLCISCPKVVQICNQRKVAEIVLPFLVADQNSHRLQHAVGQLLMSLSDENRRLSRTLLHSKNLSILKSVLLSPHSTFHQLYTKVVTCRIIYHVLCCANSPPDCEMVTALSQMFLSTLGCDVNLAMEELALICGRELSQDASSLEFHEKSEEVACLIKSQELVLETVANIFLTGDPEGEWDDVDSSEEVDSDDKCEDDDSFNEASNENSKVADKIQEVSAMDLGNSSEFQPTFTAELQSRLKLEGIFAKVFSLMNLTDLEVLNLPKDHRISKILSECINRKLQTLLGCLSNLLVASEVDQLGGGDILYRLAEWLLEKAKKWQKEDSQLFTQITGALSSTIQKLVSISYPKFEETCVVLLENLFELGKVSNDDGDKTAQVNLLRSVSSVGVLIARKSPTAPALLKIAECLYHVASSEEHLWLSAEALDAILDIFAEDDTDLIVREFQMVKKLQSLYPNLQRKFQMKQKTFDDKQLGVIDTVLSNLPHFITYKTSRLLTAQAQ